jgi:hypothetical protein
VGARPRLDPARLQPAPSKVKAISATLIKNAAGRSFFMRRGRASSGPPASGELTRNFHRLE